MRGFPHRGGFPLAVVVGILGCACPAFAQDPACGDLAAPRRVAGLAGRPLDPSTLLSLVDIGQGENGSWQPSPLGLSPDGRRIAFQMRRAMSATNDFCLGMFVLNIGRDTVPLEIDSGGELVTGTMSLRGLAAVPVGMPAIIVPQWSPDGQWVAYLKRVHGSTQVWRARADGGLVKRLTRAPEDVEAFAWSADGRSLVYATRPAIAQARRAIEIEAFGGYHYDARFSPVLGPRPQPTEPAPLSWSSLDLASGTVVAVAKQDIVFAPLSGAAVPAFLDGDPHIATSGYSASIRSGKVHDLMAPKEVALLDPLGKPIACPDGLCTAALDLWWSHNGRTLWFLRREGWAQNRMGLYAWHVADERPRRIFATDGVLVGCRLARDKLLCLFEAATSPARIVRIDPRTGKMTTLFNPNPHLAAIGFGHVQRLFATTLYGQESFADLVLPPDHRPGQRHPLVVVQYSSRGFLRGGTGDEFPIQPLAAAGMAVLSFQRPHDYVVEEARGLPDITYAEQKDWGDRRNVQSALDGLIAKAIATGTIDAGRIGLTGLSDGASSAQFALLNGHYHYSALSLASCCEDPQSFTALGGPALAKARATSGYPAWGNVQDPWARYALSRNAAQIDTPLLLQLADSEYAWSLETVAALVAQHRCVDLYVFPDERHIKWQPAHRLAIYERNLDWFRFWLLGTGSQSIREPARCALWNGLPTRHDRLSVPPA